MGIVFFIYLILLYVCHCFFLYVYLKECEVKYVLFKDFEGDESLIAISGCGCCCDYNFENILRRIWK